MNNNINICIDARYIFPNIDGIGRYLFNLIKHLSNITYDRPDIKFEVLEIEKFSKNSILRNLDERKNITFIKIPVLPQTIFNHFIYYYLRKKDISLYHYPQFDFPLIMKFPSVVTIHDLNPQTYPKFFKGTIGWFKKYYSIFENSYAIRKSDRIIAISENTKKEIINFWGKCYEEKIDVVYLGVDEKFRNVKNNFYYRSHINILRNKYHFDDYFLYVGNNRPHKNIISLLKAFKEFKLKSQNKIKLLLIGNFFDNRLNFFEILDQLDLKLDVINFSASDEELIALYLFAKAFIYISLSEGFGLPILEAMSLGTPVITSNKSSLKEIGGNAALLVDPLNIQEIALAMENVLNDNLRIELVNNGYKKAQNFTWEICANKTLATYMKVIESRKNFFD